MAPHTMQPDELLQYLPEYRVVVCASCQYAIQPNAITRHLKDIHRIHRSHRRPFMQYVSKLDLDDPHDVNRCEVHAFPVPSLPVQDGLQCQHDDCFHLCASEKRMKSHWTSVHGRSGQATRDWHPVPLQTFFRGNLLRYFTPPSSNASCHSQKSQSDQGYNNEDLEVECNDSVKCDIVLDELDDNLLHHYTTFTHQSLVTSADTETIWQTTVPQLAYQHSFLMHGLLACSALHLAHKNPSQQRELVLRASHHQDLAMPLFRSAIANVDEENCHAILAFSHLLVIYSFASENEEERLLIVEEDGPELLPSWLYFLRNGCYMVCSVWHRIESGPLKALVTAWEMPIKVLDDSRTHLVSNLLSAIPRQSSHDAWSDEICGVYHAAAVELGWAFSCTLALGETFTTWDALRIWPMKISTEYISLLREGHPAALILLAHYCILLQKVESHWYFEGQATRLLSTILHRLEKKWHRHIDRTLGEI